MNRNIVLARELCRIANTLLAMSKPLTQQEFIKRAKAKFGTRYGYSRVRYVDYETPVWIWCRRHREWFQQAPEYHLRGIRKCPKCKNRSKGQENFEKALKENGIRFTPQKRFTPGKYEIQQIKQDYGFDITKAPYDFYVSGNGKKFLVQIQGEQHWDEGALIRLSHGKSTLDRRILVDKGKKKFAEQHGYTVLQVPNASRRAIENIPAQIKQCYCSTEQAISQILGTNLTD